MLLLAHCNSYTVRVPPNAAYMQWPCDADATKARLGMPAFNTKVRITVPYQHPHMVITIAKAMLVAVPKCQCWSKSIIVGEATKP